jgi:HAD superfamily hydrolase (TIGR01484 family)
MLPVSAIPEASTQALRGLLFDLDDTLLEHGRLLPQALDALYRLRDGGFELWAVTGRPAAWGAVITHQWPIDGAVTENGAIAVRRDGGRVVLDDPLTLDERRRRREELATIAEAVRAAHPELVATDDLWQRSSDFTFDIGEQRQVARDVVDAARRTARALGAATVASSVHLHVSLDRADKASGCLRLLAKPDPMAVLRRYAFIGDSENDAACFAAFRVTIGVKNLSGRSTVSPRYRTLGESAKGFIETADLLLSRAAPTSGKGQALP